MVNSQCENLGVQLFEPGTGPRTIESVEVVNFVRLKPTMWKGKRCNSLEYIDCLQPNSGYILAALKVLCKGQCCRSIVTDGDNWYPIYLTDEVDLLLPISMMDDYAKKYRIDPILNEPITYQDMRFIKESIHERFSE